MKMMIVRLIALVSMAAGTLALASMPARALVEIDINKGNIEPLPIAITDFLSGDTIGAEIAGVIAADLKRSGLFAPVEKSPIPMSLRASRTGASSTPRRW